MTFRRFVFAFLATIIRGGFMASLNALLMATAQRDFRQIGSIMGAGINGFFSAVSALVASVFSRGSNMEVAAAQVAA